MRTFWQIFKSEFKMLKRLEYMICLILLFLLALVFFKVGLDNYSGMQEEKDTFKKYEKASISRIPDYNMYAVTGHRLLFVHAPTVAFFSNSLIGPSLTAFVDGGEVIKMYWQARGKHLFAEKPKWEGGFSLILLLLGGLLVSYYGFSAYQSVDYLNMLSSIGGSGRVYWLIFFSRAVIIAVYFALIFAGALLHAVFNGITLSSTFILYTLVLYIGLMSLQLLLFSTGILVGMIPRKPLGIIVLFISSCFISYGLPKTVDLFYKNDITGVESVYDVDYRALRIILDFQEKIDKTVGKYNESRRSTETGKAVAEEFWNNDLKNILHLDNNLREKCKAHLSRYRMVSSILPGTFYSSIADSTSGCGYEREIDFWEFSSHFKLNFCRYYLNKKFYTKETKITNFVQRNENIYESLPELPQYFILGAFSSLAYVILFSFLGHLLFIRQQKRIPARELEKMNSIKMKIKTGRISAWVTNGPYFAKRLIGIFSPGPGIFGNKELSHPPEIDGKSMAPKQFPEPPLYLCIPEQVPGYLRTRDLVSTTLKIGRFKRKEIINIKNETEIDRFWDSKITDLDEFQKARLFISLLRYLKRDVCIVSELTGLLTKDDTYRIMKTLMEIAKDTKVFLYLVENFIFPDSKKTESTCPSQERAWYFRFMSIEEEPPRSKN